MGSKEREIYIYIQVIGETAMLNIADVTIPSYHLKMQVTFLIEESDVFYSTPVFVISVVSLLCLSMLLLFDHKTQ